MLPVPTSSAKGVSSLRSQYALTSNAHAHTIDYDVMRSSPCILRDPFFESHYAPETRDHVVRVRMRGGALTFALYMYNVQSVSTVLMHDIASSPASLASPATSLAEEGAGDARLHFG